MQKFAGACSRPDSVGPMPAAASSSQPADSPSSPAPPQTDDAALIAALRQDLVQAGFTNEGVADLLGEDAVAAMSREQVVPGQLRVLEALADPAGEPTDPRWACAVLTGLWLTAVEVTAEQVDAALPRIGVQGLQQLGLAAVRPADDSAERATVVVLRADLRPYQIEGFSDGGADLWVVSDLSAHQLAGALPRDHVLGIGQASLTLATSTHRRPAAAALDIGTGCGIQLLHLLGHCDHVTGTDVSVRALQFARFNLLLNADALYLDPDRLSDRVELLHGSLLEPVVGRSFDLVVSNPPFVITPRSAAEAASDRYTYRDGGREGDALMAELIAGIPEVLNPGATVQMLGNWEVHTTERSRSSGSPVPSNGAEAQEPSSPHLSSDAADWTERPRQWIEDSGLHAWFIQRDSQTPSEYAETWLRDASEERGIGEYRRRYAQYLADFHARGVGRIGFGLIWLKRPESGAARSASAPRHRLEELLGPVEQPLGPVIGETASRMGESADSVMDRHLVVPESVTEERYQRFGSEHPEVIIARQGGGLRRARPISSAAAGFLAAADGDFSAAELVTAVCSLTQTEEFVLQEEVLDLYVEGFLT